ncbi:MAG: selenocysteine-specific translation elongation factor [Sedimentisphaerales bacterium]|nr:selenocysteine-specific translation elongation factor [Sedimentisphaerales bacterium]
MSSTESVRKNITLGTAGHIDHGKTALVKCLTGCDTDFLKEEKERGMSIDLGFAPCTISGLEVGIVDVPGHENFIKTMVAGASGIDGVMFIIAADDGVMPQTREHLDIITLLGVKYGIVALTKADCVSPERLEIVTTEIRNFLAGTFLENAPILPVSSITGQGFGSFYDALLELVDSIEPKQNNGIFRLPVERVFSVKGYGTVISGIPVSGLIKVGDEVMLYPHNSKGRIKAIQVYKDQSEIAMVGQCAALNVAQWDYKTIKRGCCVTLGEYYKPEQWFLCKLRILDNIERPVKNGIKVKFHTGTSEVISTLYLLESNNISAGQECFAQIRLNEDEKIVAGHRDRFILRSLSPVQTLGGGIIIEAVSHKYKRNHSDVIEDIQERQKAVMNNRAFVEYAIKNSIAHAADKTELSVRTKILPAEMDGILGGLVKEGKVSSLDSKLFVHKDTLLEIQKKLVSIIADFHNTNPESPGIALEQMHEISGLKKDVFDGILKLLIFGGKLVERKNRIALSEHVEKFSDSEQKLIQNVESLYKNQLFNPPDIQEVMKNTKVSLQDIRKILKILSEQQKLVRVENDMFFHNQAIEQARETLISYINQNGGLESVKFKYLLNTTRKYAIPLLDYFDKIGLTRRTGYTRTLRNPKVQ